MKMNSFCNSLMGINFGIALILLSQGRTLGFFNLAAALYIYLTMKN